MIAKATTNSFLNLCRHSASSGDCHFANEQTRIWNRLFEGSLMIQLIKLRFHDCDDADVITVIALDFRPAGWVVTGLRLGSQQTIEHDLHRISDVEVLGAVTACHEVSAYLPPMA